MESWYYEKTVYRKKTGKDDLISLAAVVGTLAICIVSYYFLKTYSFIIWLGVVYACYRIVASRKFDYEYIFVEDTLTIDKIINKSRRQNIFTHSLKDFEILAYKDSAYLNEYVNNVQQVIDVSAPGSEDTVFGVAYYKSMRTLVYFEQDERIMEFIHKYAQYKFKE
ncbi:MAG: DUF6106 family protein [Clostridia bacterium]|jgi:hypothetical protein|nr:hypothetical protein [Clostridia bacterium]NLV34865.1 hypothetical protein [Clostridiaceae bacterium]MDD4501696.1 DUF6106 family protein [Clostridia bacterium]HPB16577.1 DUF6106 family protein [Clostridia bacterium]HQM95462.1 DUF6106 family protein [Clostridia bacterium]